MKRKVNEALKIFGMVVFMGLATNTANAYGADVQINKTNFPDKFIRSTVKEYDANKDGKLSNKEIKKIKRLSGGTAEDYYEGSGKTIYSLKGVEHLYNLESIHCDIYKIKKADFSHNKKLKDIHIEYAGGLKY